MSSKGVSDGGKTIWTQNTGEFKAKWAGREGGIKEIVDMITDLVAILEALEKKP